MLSFRDGLNQWSKAMDDSGTLLFIVTDETDPYVFFLPVLTPQFVEDAVRLLISRFMPLTEDDLNEWLADPESWVTTEDTESDMWQYELRVKCFHNLD